MSEQLAINGGPKAVTSELCERWPIMGEEEIQQVVSLMTANQVSVADGRGIIGQFEHDFADYHGMKYAIAQNNGTSTLHAAYFAVGVGPGDEVIVPTYTWHSTASPILNLGATPVFCDVDPRTFTADPADIERKITPRTKAVAVVHLWGHPAEMDAILDICRRHGLKLIEDCSHAHGATYKGQKVGTFGDVSCYSLQGSKAMVGGEAGVVMTNDPEYHDRILALGHYGRLDHDFATEKYRDFWFTAFGYKYRAHPLGIGIAEVQLKHLDEVIAARKENLEYLSRRLAEAEIDGIEPMYTAPYVTRGGWYGYRVQYYAERFGGLPREKFIDALRAEGVDADSERYHLLHLEPLYNGADLSGRGWPFDGSTDHEWRYHTGDFPQAETVHPRLISLPTFTMRPATELIDQYVEAFKKVAEHADELR